MPEPQYQHKFRYPVHELKAGETVLEKWPELATNEVLVTYGFGENDMFLRYAMYLGEGSGLHTAVPDWNDRKVEAARLAGVKPTHPRYDAMLALTDDGTQELRWTWMRLTSSRLYRAYVAGCELFDQNCRKVEAPIPEAGTVEMPDGSEDGKKFKNSSDLKADAEARTYHVRNQLFKELAAQDEVLKGMEAKLFFDDSDIKQKAIEAARPQAKSGGLEDLVFNKRKGK